MRREIFGRGGKGDGKNRSGLIGLGKIASRDREEERESEDPLGIFHRGRYRRWRSTWMDPMVCSDPSVAPFLLEMFRRPKCDDDGGLDA